MKVLLVFPHLSDNIDIYTNKSLVSNMIRHVTGWGGSNFMPPLSLLMLAAVTPPDVEVKLVDERVDRLDFDEPTDLVGLTVVTRSAPRAYAIADRFRLQGVKVVMGGVHPSAMPGEALLHADAVVLGEGEGVWPELLNDFRNGCLKQFYRGRIQRDLDALPFPRRDIIPDPEKYLTTKAVIATRGCPNTCTFCSAGVGLIKTYRKRGVAKIIAELEQTPGKLTTFVDDNLGWDVDYTKELFRAMIPLHTLWTGELTFNALRDPELIDLAAASGGYLLSVGLESLSPRVIASIRKDKTNQPEHYAPAIRRAQQAGIAVWGNFILGFDEETPDTLPRILEFVHETHMEMVNIYILLPYPGSVLFKKYEQQGRLLHKDWNFYESVGGHCIYIPKLMSARQLMDTYQEALEKVYALRSIFSRLLQSPSRLRFGSLAALHLNLENRNSIRLQKENMYHYIQFLENSNLPVDQRYDDEPA